MFVVFSKTHF